MLKDLNEKLKLYGLKKFIKYSFSEVCSVLYWRGIRKSYSQKQEDLIIDKLLSHKKNGFYVDIGTSDPNRFNNTKRFYLKGWHGINIEPNPRIFERIKEDRKKDINLNIGIGDNEGKMNFFIFFPDTLSTFSEEEAKNYIKQGFRIIKEVRKLVKVFEEYAEETMDFLSIDTEGCDLDVLKSNNWERYRPKLICVELYAHNENNSEALNIENYLTSVDYLKKVDNKLNGIFVDSKN